MTPELLAKMAAGRKAAAEARAAAKAAAPNEPAPLAPAEREYNAVAGVIDGLSAAELARIREEARKKVDKEIEASRAAEREKLMGKALDAEIQEQRKAAGLTNDLDDMIDILIDVAPFADNITIDGKVFQHGHWYSVERRQAKSIEEIMARSWDSEERAGNPNRRFRREVAGTMNPLANERRAPDGTFTLNTPTINARTGTVS